MMIVIVFLLLILGFLVFVNFLVGVIKEPEPTKPPKKPVQTPTRGEPAEHYLISILETLGFDNRAIFNDLYILNNNRHFTQIDVVMPTRIGVFVFEVKDYKGWVFGDCQRKRWVQCLQSYKKARKFPFYNPIFQNQSHITALKNVLKEDVPFYSVICFLGDAELKSITNTIPENTFIVSSEYQIGETLTSLLKNKPVAQYKDKQRVLDVLQRAVDLGDDPEVRRAQVNYAQYIQSKY